MCSSRWGFWLVLAWLGCSVTSSGAVTLVNGTTNSFLWVSNALGRAWCPPGTSLKWDRTAGGDVDYGFDGVRVGAFALNIGSVQEVYLSEAGVFIVDDATVATVWFWAGLVLGFVWEFQGVGVGWIKRIIGGGGYNE